VVSEYADDSVDASGHTQPIPWFGEDEIDTNGFDSFDLYDKWSPDGVG
jgi:hypothetical protein